MPVSTVRAVNINARFILKFVLSLFCSQDSQERLLRNLNGSYLFHSALAGLLFLKEFALARHVATIAFRGYILAQCLDRTPGNYLATNCRLYCYIEHLPWNKFPHSFYKVTPARLGIIPVNDD
jgi:hypothetical protein